MTRISSKTTFYTKRIFPLFWFGFLAVFVIMNVLSGLWRKAPQFLFIPIGMGGFGFFVFKKLVWDLMDEVYDCGDTLLIRNRGKEDSVHLADIVNVSSTTFVNPPRITLRLVTAGKFGAEVSFSPSRPLLFRPFASTPIAVALITRADAARRERYLRSR